MPKPPDYGIIYNWDGNPHGYSEYPQSMESFLEKVYGPMEDTQVGAHFHLHVVPRRKDSDWGKGPPQIEVLEERDESVLRRVRKSVEQEREMAERIRSNL
jgi:diadenosine tetraphosphate (Ap4A) HIT family hydrolase